MLLFPSLTPPHTNRMDHTIENTAGVLCAAVCCRVLVLFVLCVWCLFFSSVFKTIF